MRLLIEKVIVSPQDLEVRFRANGIEVLALELQRGTCCGNDRGGRGMSEILIDRTGQPAVIAASDGSLTVTVPIRIKRRGFCKAVTLPDGGSVQPRPWDDKPTPLQLALARGHRWLAMLESGEAKSLKEIAIREGVDDSYVSRMVNLTTFAPDIVAAILDETLPREVKLFDLVAGTPLLWEEQWGRVEESSCPRFIRTDGPCLLFGDCCQQRKPLPDVRR